MDWQREIGRAMSGMGRLDSKMCAMRTLASWGLGYGWMTQFAWLDARSPGAISARCGHLAAMRSSIRSKRSSKAGGQSCIHGAILPIPSSPSERLGPSRKVRWIPMRMSDQSML
jgi:hypothetical protein